MYSTPLTSPPTMIGEIALSTVNALGLQVAVYVVIGALPVLEGGEKLILARVWPGVAVPIMGASGAAPVMVMSKTCSARGKFGPLAMTLPVNVPNALGVPEMTPVAVLSVTPGGSASCFANVIVGSPVATNVCEYGTFRKPPRGNAL